MKCQWTAAILCAIVVASPCYATAQSLAEVARQEAARRQTVTKGKVITNEDLKPVPPPSSTPTPSTPGTTLPPPPSLEKATGTPAEAEAAGDTKAASGPTEDEKKDEKYWRERMATARDNLSRAQLFQDALQTRIAALSTDFVNRDDPAQRAQVALDRQKALDELARVKKDIEQYQTELSAIAEDARRAGVPAGWVR
jgi:hypothetical protein